MVCEAVRSAFGVKVWIASLWPVRLAVSSNRRGFSHYTGLASYGFSGNQEAGEMSLFVGVEGKYSLTKTLAPFSTFMRIYGTCSLIGASWVKPNIL
jgi:hypothetical protein